ncbi:c-type cytochrome [Bradyrhizobium sp. STM 3557]|uniref:c-type cytochrome n=1 Tax=Bradyrhizobium sp. STM 3557 TaxID=578920 RepID=UPI00388FFC8C
MPEMFDVALPIVLAALLTFASLRAFRHKRRLVRWGVGSIAALLTLIATITSVFALAGLSRLNAHGAPAVSPTIAGTAEQVQRGHEIADGFCSGCHAPDDITATLTGDRDLGRHLPLPLGSFVAPNLTPAGRLARWSDGDIFRAIRNGVDPGGRRLFIMSLTNASGLSDDDTKAVIAYLRSLRADGRDTGATPDRFSLLGLVMLGAHLLPEAKPVPTGVVIAPAKAPTAEFGEYILSYQDCRGYHGKALTGGVPGQLPPLGPDLNVVKVWSFDQFAATMRTGVDPTGHELGKEMPWRPIGRMSDDELRAIYEYLMHLPAS